MYTVCGNVCNMAEETIMHSNNCTRVMLWCIPRSVSTSFLKCMTNVPSSQCWFEPYLMACCFSKYGKYRKRFLASMQSRGAEESTITDTFASEIEGKGTVTSRSMTLLLISTTTVDLVGFRHCRELRFAVCLRNYNS